MLFREYVNDNARWALAQPAFSSSFLGKTISPEIEKTHLTKHSLPLTIIT
jgi:hypothetical protein